MIGPNSKDAIHKRKGGKYIQKAVNFTQFEIRKLDVKLDMPNQMLIF